MRNTVKNYLVLLLTTPTFVFICLICIFMSVFMLNNATKTIMTDAGNLGDYLAENYERQIETIQDDILNEKAVSDYLNDPGNAAFQSEAATYLTDIANRNETIRRSSFISSTGTILVSSNPDLIGKNQADTLFEDCMKTGQAQTGVELDGDLPLMVICYPIDPGSDFVAVYRRTSPLYYLQDYITNITHDQKSVYIVTKNRTGLIAQGDVIEPIDAQTPGDQEIGMLRSLLYDGINTKEYTGEVDDNDSVNAYSIEPDIGWISMVTENKALIYYDLNRFQLIMIFSSVVLLAVMILAGSRFFKDHIGPVFDYVSTIRDFLAGNHKLKVDEDHPLIVGELGETINSLFVAVDDADRLNDELRQQLSRALTTDAITGLSNYETLKTKIDESFDKEEPQALIVYNIGTYDSIDATFGKERSDQLLNIIAERSRPYAGDNLLGRIKRDLFCLYLPNYESKAEVNIFVNELAEMLSDIRNIGDIQVALNPHVAVIFRDDHIEDAQDWLDIAEDVLTQAEEENSQVVIFDFSWLDESEDDQLLENIFLTDTPVWNSYRQKK